MAAKQPHGEEDHRVQEGKQPTPPNAIVVEERDVESSTLESATVSAASASTTTTSESDAPSTSVFLGPPEMKWKDFLDPFRYELRVKHLKRPVNTQRWGIEVAAVGIGTDVVMVAGVVKGSAACAANVESGSYLVAVNGKRISNPRDAQVQLDSNRNGIRIVFALKRKPPLDPRSPIALPSSWERAPENDYLIIRIDPTDGKRVGTGVGVDRCGRIFISIVLKDSAGAAAGLKVGDRVVTVNGVMILARHQCRTLVREVSGNPFDMVIERPRDAQEHHGAAPQPLVNEKEGGEPSMGVPDCPEDVAVFLETNAKQVIEKIAQGTKSRGKKPKSRSKRVKAECRVKLQKDVNTSKLKR